jgi:hypothetical protein
VVAKKKKEEEEGEEEEEEKEEGDREAGIEGWGVKKVVTILTHLDHLASTVLDL